MEEIELTGIKAVDDRIRRLKLMEQDPIKVRRRHKLSKINGIAVEESSGEILPYAAIYSHEDTGEGVQNFKRYNIVNEQAEEELLNVCNGQDYAKLRKMTHMVIDSSYLLYNAEGNAYHTAETLRAALKLGNNGFYKTINSLIKAYVLAKVVNGSGVKYIINPTYFRKGPYRLSIISKYFDNVDLSKGIPRIEINEKSKQLENNSDPTFRT